MYGLHPMKRLIINVRSRGWRDSRIGRWFVFGDANFTIFYRYVGYYSDFQTEPDDKGSISLDNSYFEMKEAMYLELKP